MDKHTITDQYAAIIAGDLAEWIDENHSRANELWAQAASEVDMLDPVVHILSRWLVLLKKAINEMEEDHG